MEMEAITRRNARIALVGLALAACLLAVAPAGASAALTIEEPAAGVRTGPTPTFAGSTGDSLDAVQVRVYPGSSALGTPALTLTAGPLLGQWSATPTNTQALEAGAYTAIAEQEGLLEPGPTETAGPVHFTVDTEPPIVTISGPPARSGGTTPAFSGAAGEAGTVVVHVMEGTTEVAKAEAAVAGGEWSTSTLSKALASGKHSYTAFATEESNIGNGPGTSGPVSFEIDTEAPAVTIEGPPSPTNDTTPPFAGTASEDTKITVHVKEGTTEVAKAETTASGGKWSTSTLSKALASGKHSYTAFATEESAIGNPDGESSAVGFEVNTAVPQLTLATPLTPANNTTPSFSGTSTEAGEVEVQISLNGKVVSTADAESHGGSWSSGIASPALPGGKHAFTALAVQSSTLGNGVGHSNTVTFEVNTGTPTVTLTGPSRSNNRTPTFAGTASEETEVEVHVFLGPTEVATAKTTASGGLWSTPALSPALSTGNHTYTAFATETSAVGNPGGQSATVSFEVNTEAPKVSLVGPPARSNDPTPKFSGTTSEDGKVTVHVLAGTVEVSKVETTSSGEAWSATLAKALTSGKYTAFASEQSGIGNGEGKTATVAFEVESEPPTVTIKGPPSPSNSTNPSFSGSASESTEVEVHVFQGGSEVAKATTSASGGTWSTSGLSKALPSGKHSFTAFATEKSGVGNEAGKSASVRLLKSTPKRRASPSPSRPRAPTT